MIPLLDYLIVFVFIRHMFTTAAGISLWGSSRRVCSCLRACSRLFPSEQSYNMSSCCRRHAPRCAQWPITCWVSRAVSPWEQKLIWLLFEKSYHAGLNHFPQTWGWRVHVWCFSSSLPLWVHSFTCCRLMNTSASGMWPPAAMSPSGQKSGPCRDQQLCDAFGGGGVTFGTEGWRWGKRSGRKLEEDGNQPFSVTAGAPESLRECITWRRRRRRRRMKILLMSTVFMVPQSGNKKQPWHRSWDMLQSFTLTAFHSQSWGRV